jgi:hypothetical protein
MRRGEVTKRRIDRAFPHQVAILIPVGGLVARLMAMHKFCDTRSMLYKTHADLRREPPADFMRFCFADPAHADAFMAERTTIEPPRIGRNSSDPLD